MSLPESDAPFEPRRPALLAVVVFVLAALSLCWPMLSGQYLLGDDQYLAGYGFRLYGAEMFRETGSIPQWNPYAFGGMPFIAAMHGDIFYPTAWLRWVLPIDTAMNLGFAAHLILAGWAMYALLRALRLGWIAAVVGGVGYELSGIVASQVSPGHDGKLFVSALAPFAFLALLRAVRDGRVWGYGLLALIVGLGLLSPHYQMTYYLLVAAGMFTLYLVFFDPERRATLRWPVALGAALGAVLLGIALSALQAFPFLSYLPYAARGANQGWEYATAWSMPIEEIVTTVLPQFNGVLERYWGQNFFKSHTEYLGAAIVPLAALGLTDRRQGRLRWAWLAIAVLFLLVSFGAHTPFYRLWYEVMPMMKKVRAAGMAFVMVALPVSVFAAFGVDRLLRGQATRRVVLAAAGAVATLALLGAIGFLQPIAETLADPRMVERVVANDDALRGGALRLLVVALLGGAVLWAAAERRLRGPAVAAALVALVAVDHWSVLRPFFHYREPARELFADDEITTYLKAQPAPFRVLNAPDQTVVQLPPVYRGSWLMAHRIQSAFGYHGNEVRFYDELWGGKNIYQHLANPNLWNLWAVRYALIPGEIDVPGYHKVLGPSQTRAGATGVLYERDTLAPYVRIVPAAAKVADSLVVPTVLDPRFPVNDFVLFADTTSVAVTPVVPGAPPAPSPIRAALAEWAPGRMRIGLEGRDTRQTYLLVSETWYPDWRATVDGQPAPVHRADHAMMAVVVPPGTREVRLEFRSDIYATGKLVSLAALLAIAALLVGPVWRGRRAAHA